MKIIALEEHFSPPWMPFPHPKILERTRGRLKHDLHQERLDLDRSRIAHMDAAGITMQVLSSNELQQMEAAKAVPMARDVNDLAHAAIQKHPDRFAGFAVLPTDDPAASVKELDRAVTQLGFKGTMITGPTQGDYLDHKRFWPILECAEALDVPIYLHPAEIQPVVKETLFTDYEELATAAYGYTIDASTTFLRLVLSGAFDAFPRLKIIMGHFGEGLPFFVERTSAKTTYGARRRGLKRLYKDYVRDHLWVTCSGNFDNAPFLACQAALGIDKIMFAVDWPHEHNEEAVAFLMNLPICDTDRERIAFRNAEQLLKL